MRQPFYRVTPSGEARSGELSKSVMTVKLEMASPVDDDEAEGRQSLFDQWGAVGPAGR